MLGRNFCHVDGVNEEAIHEYLHETRGIPDDRLGAIIHVRTDDMLANDFPRLRWSLLMVRLRRLGSSSRATLSWLMRCGSCGQRTRS
jgi:hypothetical protein